MQYKQLNLSNSVYRGISQGANINYRELGRRIANRDTETRARDVQSIGQTI